MKVHVVKGTRGDIVCRFGVFTGLFAKAGPQPQVGQEVEVMIVCPLVPKVDRHLIKTFLVTPVTSKHVLVGHDGFHRDRFERVRANINAHGRHEIKDATDGNKRVFALSPGRTPVFADGDLPSKGLAYIDLDDIKSDVVRVSGVPAPEELAINVREKFYRAIC